MSLFLVLCAAGLSEVRISDGSGFFELPDSTWAEPGTCWADSGGDSLTAAPAARGSRTGIQVIPPPSPGDTVIIHYDTLSIRAPSRASLDISMLGREPVAPHVPSGQEDLTFQQGLVISGVKRLGFSVGHGGGLDQSTSLSVSGTLARDIGIEGELSDENLPPGGSEAVSELDRVRLSILGRSWAAHLGDMDWTRGETDEGPLSWRREASGFLGALGDSAGLSAGGGAGVSGQSHRRAVFTTLEGVSGPYPFSSGREVVPGSERVWLDGDRLSRGASSDYTIDHVAGSITFSESRLIRRDQRVEITFFSRGDGYRRELRTADAAWSAGGLQISTAGFSESDDRGSPLGFSLSEEAADLLRQTGEEPGSAWIDGATLVGPGGGSYSRDSLGRFTYEGPGMGDWKVVFSRPPDGPGDYLYDSSAGGFAWAGESLGTHLPRQYLEIPSSLQVGGVALSGSSGAAVLELEASVSKRTGNTFNPDATTREGVAARSRLVLSPGEDIGLHLTLLGASDGFRPAGVWLGDSTLSAWTLPPGYEGRDGIVELGARAGSMGAEGGFLLADGGGSIGRGSLTASPSFGNTGAEAWLEGAERKGTTLLAEGRYIETGLGLRAVSGAFRPGGGFSLRDEDWPDSLSGRLATGHVEAGLDAFGWETGIRLEAERDFRSGQVELPFRTLRGRLESGTSGSGWRFAGSLEHSTSSWTGGGSTQADAVKADFSYSAAGGWIHSAYGGTGTLAGDMEIHYRYAGEGEGEYSYDEESGQYYPDPDGDWDVYYTPGTGGEATEEASLETGFLLGGALGVSLEGTVDLTSRDAGGRLETFLLLGAFGRGSGGYSADLSPSWRGAGTVRLLRMRGLLSGERTVYSGAGRREETERRLEFSGRAVPEGLENLAWMAGVWRVDENLYSPRRRLGLRAEIDPTVALGGGLEAGLLGGFERRTEEYSSLEAFMYEAGPHLAWSRSGWNSSGSFSAGYIPGDMELPLWFFDGSGTGMTYSMQARIGRYVSDELALSLTFYGRRPAGSEWVRRAGLEGSVSF